MVNFFDTGMPQLDITSKIPPLESGVRRSRSVSKRRTQSFCTVIGTSTKLRAGKRTFQRKLKWINSL
ncbi:MAG: hypothetical protein PUP91_26555 [Rhizonema sp. PD37]|nr:hypothetical protein [Rhizonema sp. PD37]